MPDFTFRLPSINDLTMAQIRAYREREGSVLVTGGPGSGKTVVSIHRFLRSTINDTSSIFFTYHRTLIASIRGTLRQQADILLPDLVEADVDRLLDRSVSSIASWYDHNFNAFLADETNESIVANIRSIENPVEYNFDEIFIDEAQDLKPAVFEAMIILARRFTCGADRAQDLNGHYIDPVDEVIKALLEGEGRSVLTRELSQNFRNTRQIFDFARKFVPEDISVQQLDMTELNDGEVPEIMCRSEAEQLDLIIQIVRDNPNSNIGILVHFYWQIDNIRDNFIKNGFSCEADAEESNSFSYYYSRYTMNSGHRDLMERRLRTPFILTFDSCKGLEFDIVIIPMFERSDWAMSNPKKKRGTNEPDRYADGQIKYFASRNHYYVACTRARRQLYVMYAYKPKILDFYNDADNTNIKVELPF